MCIIKIKNKAMLFLSHLKRKEIKILDKALKGKETKAHKYILSCTYVLKTFKE